MIDRQVKKDRPHLLLILVDQWRGDCLGCLKHPVIETPHLDALAAQGQTFTRAYSPCPSCIPARRSLMTGMTPHRAGMVGYVENKPWPYQHTLAGELKRAGYQTINVGKTHFYPRRLRLGFEELIETEDYFEWLERKLGAPHPRLSHGVPSNAWWARPHFLPEHQFEEFWLVSRAIERLEKRDPTRPFFLCLSLNGPHPPWCPPRTYFELFQKRAMPQPAVGDWAKTPLEGSEIPLDTGAWRGHVSDHVSQRTRAAYFAFVAFIDAQIGRFLHAMGPLADDCLIIFASDHGEMLGDQHLWRKTYAYDPSARIPLILRAPIDGRRTMLERQRVPLLMRHDLGIDGPHNQRIDLLVGLENIMPTLLEAAAAACPPTVLGRSLMPLLSGQKTAWRERYHLEHSPCYHPHNAHQTWLDTRYKYIWNPSNGEDHLFDLHTDPGELVDLARQAGARTLLQRKREELADHLKDRPEGISDGRRLIPNTVLPWCEVEPR